MAGQCFHHSVRNNFAFAAGGLFCGTAFRIHDSVVRGEIDSCTNHKPDSKLSRRKKIFPEKMIVEARKELFEIREGILKLMDEFRRRG